MTGPELPKGARYIIMIEVAIQTETIPVVSMIQADSFGQTDSLDLTDSMDGSFI